MKSEDYRSTSYEVWQVMAPGWERWRGQLEAALAPRVADPRARTAARRHRTRAWGRTGDTGRGGRDRRRAGTLDLDGHQLTASSR